MGVERRKFPFRPQFGLYAPVKGQAAGVPDKVAALRVVSLLLGQRGLFGQALLVESGWRRNRMKNRTVGEIQGESRSLLQI